MATMTAAQAKAIQQQKNADFMRLGYPQPIAANAQNGTTYQPGTLYNFDVPIVAGAFVESVRVYWTLNFTNTAGSSPSIAKTAAGEYAMFNDISVTFGNKQASLHPYFTKSLSQLRGYNRSSSSDTVIGASASAIQNMLYSVPAIATGVNTWKGYYDLPMTLIHPTSPYGLVPVGGSGTRMQIQLTSAASLLGPDPLNNVLALGSGGTNTITAVGGTVNVVVFYRDFKSFLTPQALECDLTGLPTAQIIRLREINPLTAGSPNYLAITNPYPFVKTLSIVIDGQSSTKFSDAANIQVFRIDGAENTGSGLRVYDVSTGGMVNYYSRHRQLYGQDADEGVLVYNANAESTTDSSDQDGEMWLNVSSSGYPAARLGFQVGTVSSANNIVPRIVTAGVILNPVGIS